MTKLKRLVLFQCFTLFVLGNVAAEVFPANQGFDQYGGYLAVKEEATGRFRLDNINGRYFLITPDGHGFVSLGVTHHWTWVT